MPILSEILSLEATKICLPEPAEIYTFILLKIKNIDKADLKISVESKKEMNIRINQIKKPDGSFDGPFGKTLDFKADQEGEYWIILGKSQMAGSSQKGHFVLKVE